MTHQKRKSWFTKFVAVTSLILRDHCDLLRYLNQQPNDYGQAWRPFAWKENCFLCTKEAAIVDSKHPNRRKIVHHAVTIGLKSKILEQCQKRNDKWGVEVETRLSCSMNLVADEGMYHSECLSRFMSFKPPHEKSLGFAGRPTNQKLLLSFNNLCIWLDNEADGELHSVRDLHVKMKDLPGYDEEVYSVVWMKKKLKERYKDFNIFCRS